MGASPLKFSRSLRWLSPVVALVVGCFDDAALKAPTSDLGAVDVPSAADGGDAAIDARGDASLDAADATVDVGDDLGDATLDADASDGGPACALDRVLVTTTNFMSGGYALGRFSPTPSLVPSTVDAPDQDHVPVQSGCVVYNLQRANDVLAVLDPMNLPTVARRIPLRMGSDASAPYQSNPYDVLTVSPSKAYVAQYAVPRVAIVDPSRDGAAALLGSIDLAPVRAMADMDPSGSPEPIAFARVGRRVFLGLQNLNSFAPSINSALAVIDPERDVLIDADPATDGTSPVQLTGRNLLAMEATRGGRLVVAEAGVITTTTPQRLDGLVELVDPATLRASGALVTEMELGGDIGGMVMVDESRAWVVVTQVPASSSSSRVVEVNLDAAAGARIIRTIMSTGSIAALARDPSGNVWVLDRTMGAAGARVFNPMGMELTSTPLSTGSLPPFGIAFVP